MSITLHTCLALLSQVMHEGMMRERELALQKVELQVQLRDRALKMLCREFRSQGVDVNSVVARLAQGPMESIFSSLIDSSQPAEPVDDAEDGEDDVDFRKINHSFNNLAQSLKRSTRLEQLMAEEEKESKRDDDDDYEEGPTMDDETIGSRMSRYTASTADHLDAEELNDDTYEEYDDDDDEFEPEVPPESPVKPPRR